MGSLDLMSGAVESGDDFVAENTIFTVHITGLHPGTLYYYQVSATNNIASTLSDIELFQTGDQRKLLALGLLILFQWQLFFSSLSSTTMKIDDQSKSCLW